MGFLQGKRILVTGVLSNRSIAYGIANACRQQGADIALTYVGERFKERVQSFAAELGSQIVDFMDKLPDLTRNLQWNNPLSELADCLKTSNL